LKTSPAHSPETCHTRTITRAIQAAHSPKKVNNIFIALLTAGLFLGFFSAANAQEPDWKKYSNTREKLTAIQKYGSELTRKQQFVQATPLFYTALAIARQASLDSFASANLYSLGIVYRYRSLFDSASYVLQEGRKLADQNNYLKLQALIRLELYSVYNRRGKADSAALMIAYLSGIATRLDSNGNERARLELVLGHEAKHKAKFDEALRHYYRALDIFTLLRDSMNEGTMYISLANVLVIMGQTDKALAYHREASEILTRLGRRYELGNELLNITDLYYTSGKLDSAEIAVRKALVIAQELNEKSYLVFGYMHLGNIYKRRKQFPEAENYMQLSISTAETMGMQSALASSYQALGEMYMEEKQPARAKPYLEKHLLLSKNNKDIEEIIQAYWNMAQNEYALKNYAKAFEYQKLYSTFMDSSYSESASRHMAEMDAKYQNEKKEEQILVLKKDQELSQVNFQKQKNFQIGLFLFFFFLLLIGFLIYSRNRVVQRIRQEVDMEKMRNTIARDLHDDIGSTLTSINILSKVALEQSSGEGGVVSASLHKIKDRSAAIMESMSDIVWAINPHNDTMEKLIFRMKEFAAEILEPLNINYSFKEEGNFSSVKLNVKKRKDFYLLFKEAVHNAARHSRCRNLFIHLQQDQQFLRLKVTDDGTGFDAGIVRNGNGLANMHARASSMSATFNIDTAPEKGASILLVAPIT
jgi:two-component system sensor histidine kinase UhpB